MRVTVASAEVCSTSPELVLVDAACAEVERSRLPRPDDTLARLELLVRSHRIVEARTRVALPEPASAPAPEPVTAPARADVTRPRRHVRPKLLAACATALLVLLALVGMRALDATRPKAEANVSIGTTAEHFTPQPPPIPARPRAAPRSARPARAPTRAQVKPSTPRARRQAPTPPRRALESSHTAKRFVWAPAPGAAGYRVQIFRASTLVFSADTSEPSTTVPATWTQGGARRSLDPGTYRWYVWPLVEGRPASKAIVQSTLVVPKS